MPKLPLALALIALVTASPSQAVTVVPLASTMDPNGFFSENLLTGSMGRINLGDGGPGDRDAPYDINDPSVPLGGAAGFDIFPNEENFIVGSLTYDEGLLTGAGVEQIAVSTIDLTALRTDINEVQLTALYNTLQPFVFGSLGAGDTLTFTNGQLTSIDVSIEADWVILDNNGPQTFDGDLTFSGNQVSWSLSDTENLDFTPFVPTLIPSTVTVELDGTVAAVVPEPASGALALLGTAGLLVRRRR